MQGCIPGGKLDVRRYTFYLWPKSTPGNKYVCFIEISFRFPSNLLGSSLSVKYSPGGQSLGNFVDGPVTF